MFVLASFLESLWEDLNTLVIVIVSSRHRCTGHSLLTSDTEHVPVASGFSRDQTATKTATGKQLVEWKQSTKVINILVEVQAATQKLYLQDGSSCKGISATQR